MCFFKSISKDGDVYGVRTRFAISRLGRYGLKKHIRNIAAEYGKRGYWAEQYNDYSESSGASETDLDEEDWEKMDEWNSPEWEE